MVKFKTYSDIETLSKSQSDTRLLRQNDALKSETPWPITKDSEIWNEVKVSETHNLLDTIQSSHFVRGVRMSLLIPPWLKTISGKIKWCCLYRWDNLFETLVTKQLLTTFHLTPVLLVTHDQIFKI